MIEVSGSSQSEIPEDGGASCGSGGACKREYQKDSGGGVLLCTRCGKFSYGAQEPGSCMLYRTT
jgi:hypothetical protein